MATELHQLTVADNGALAQCGPRAVRTGLIRLPGQTS